ncbi:MAG: response regulator transcription factor [Steroidobacteraceae bacterium]
MTRILLADDHDVIRAGLRSILEPRWKVVAEAANGKEAIHKAMEFKPDVAVLDYSMPLINGVDATRQIRARVPTVEVLIFTMHESEGLMHELLEAGARGYLLKSDAKHLLINAVESLAAHRPFFTGKVSDTLVEAYLTRPSPLEAVLTSRERGVVQLIAEGHSNKQIAHVLSISVKTVESHRASVMRKLNLNSAAAVVRYAVRNKIVEA